ncbi:Wound-induced protein [Carex littledalei]|uniref:Wound-induced protein n=1 Tax=Carex littledalei TaxID=544730 RepID=A0A833VY13_9POAL|nr:Wound-induced protein [Carex littledalei]
MSGAITSKAPVVVAASVAVVEALKDQVGLCRWNYTMRSLYQRASNRAGSSSVSTKANQTVSSNSRIAERGSAAAGDAFLKAKMPEEKLNKAYHLICWGPN